MRNIRAAAARLACAMVVTGAVMACNSSETPETAETANAFRVHAIYNENADASAQVRQALAEAGREHKRVILDFGGNWCGDCQILDFYFHQPPNAGLLASDYVLVDIDVGHMDRNEEIADKYDVPLQRGVPALAVLDAQGHVIYSTTTGQFAAMGRVDPAQVTNFLEQWKGNG